jgi:hypothetical protein
LGKKKRCARDLREAGHQLKTGALIIENARARDLHEAGRRPK